MPCGCKKKANTAGNPTTSGKVMVRCEECTGPLTGTDGLSYPVHQTIVVVPQAQAQLWIEQGHSITYV